MSRLTVYPIVEGHGEFEAVRTLINRVWTELLGGEHVEVLTPHRLNRGRALKPEFLAKAVQLAALKLKEAPAPHLLLLLFDSEGGCPKMLSSELLASARKARADLDIACVLAHPMYESWFVAASQSLTAYVHLRPSDDASQAESKALGKSWLKDRMARYSETADQPSLTAAMDLRQCRSNSPSFDKLCRELGRRLVAHPPDIGG